ncbi:hypothetical protein PPYR_06010 [Photinus pyralis]|uniref:Hexosyltransferase n=1 Tax=Photinus pyralis TaxID=7054 RepID=A0A5N4ASQ8_PHOPY|nr:chondroitin sulfate synthase 1-like [Photinus pyralis]KAB0800270.1 hypothetical protein PPYR_06010 [Photinus pyralis]
MARKRKILKLFIGVIVGLISTSLFKQNGETRKNVSSCVANYDVYDSGEYIQSVINDTNEFLLAGVMTAKKYVNTRAKAVYETWGKNVPGKILFFSSEESRSNELPLIPLSGIDDNYPPQRKSFAMLKYMHDNYIDKYEWFLRADDDLYVRTDRLEELLRSVDSNKPWFIGQAGRGKPHEIRSLALKRNENYCMGGPGIILSRDTLKRIVPNIEECLRNLYSNHEDVELGRCVRKFTGISCTWAYEMQVIFYHNQSTDAFSGNLKQKYIHSAITMHPIKEPQNMYRLHDYVKGQTIQEKQQESVTLHRDISSSMAYFNIEPSQLQAAELIEDFPLYPEPPGSLNFLGDPELLGAPVSLTRFPYKAIQDVLDWELISKSLYSFKDFNPKRRIGSSIKEGLTDIVREIMEVTNSNSKQRGRVIDFKELLYVYWRLDSLHGADLILDMSLLYKKYTGNKMTVPVRRHVYVQQTFTGTFIREVTYNDETPHAENTTRPSMFVHNVLAKIGKVPLPKIFNYKLDNDNNRYVNFILPLRDRFETFTRFMYIYENVCIIDEETTRLLIVLYKNEDNVEEFEKNLELIRATQRKYPNSEISYRVTTEAFSRGKALQYGVDEKKDDDLLFFIDVDIVFTHKSLQRIRFNTVKHHQVYFPIVYSLYSPKFLNQSTSDSRQQSMDYNLSNRKGFWRQFGFGITSIFKCDFINLGGFNMSIAGWGVEDVSFFEKVIKSNYKTIRSVDPQLIHIYHPIECDNNLEQAQKNMCIGTKANILGSLYDIQNFYLKYKHLFR